MEQGSISLPLPAMLQRLKAYKEFVDKEKEALVARNEEQSKDFAVSAGKTIAELITLYSHLLPFVPIEGRRQILDDRRFSGLMKTTLLEIAQAAPDFTQTGLVSLLRNTVFASARHDVPPQLTREAGEQ